MLTYEDLERIVSTYPKAITPDDVLSTLIRPCLRAAPGKTLAIVDYASVEARGIAWVAGEQSLLDIFATDGDVYIDMASRLYGRKLTKQDKAERQVGKVVILGAGYGMSGPKLALYAAAMGVNLAAAGVTASQCIDAYRDAYPNIAGRVAGESDGRTWRRGGVWHLYDAAVKGAITEGTPHEAGKCGFWMDGRHMIICLPSGREIIYRNCRIEPRIPAYAATLGLAAKEKPTVVYDSHRGERTLYGGKIAENIVQALCRDLLATALVHCEAEGLAVVLHVHDELVVETEHGERDLHRLAAIMSEPPGWAGAFPIKVEGFVCERYVKSAWSDSPHAAYLNGRKLG